MLEDTRSLVGGGARVFHGTSPKVKAQIPVDTARETFDAFQMPPSLSSPDGISLFEDVLTTEMCEKIISLFEASSKDHYVGNTIHEGHVVVDVTRKKTLEVDVSDVRTRSGDWASIDQQLIQVLTRVVGKYVHQPLYLRKLDVYEVAVLTRVWFLQVRTTVSWGELPA